MGQNPPVSGQCDANGARSAFVDATHCRGGVSPARAIHSARRELEMIDEKASPQGAEKHAGPTAHTETQKPAPAASQAHILLFEDDETLAGLLVRVLRNEGYHVDVADNAKDVPPPAKL